LLFAARLAAADLDSNSVTVTATRTVSAQPDQVALSVDLLATPDVALDDVLARLKGSGITAADLNGVYTSYGVQYVAANRFLDWNFNLNVAFTKMKDTLKALKALQTSIPAIQDSPALTFSVTGTRYSADALAAQSCPLPALVSDARRQADAMASAAGMKTGAIVSLTDGSSLEVTVPTALQRIGDFSQISAIYDPATGVLPVSRVLTGFVLPVTALKPSCALTVQFKLLP